ncbi:MAG: aminotransferase class I/II-fold pyridoxal phosphate-dependent enzyme, partial [Burkholderiales bacterium]|nr:aminotransferase class I/II-fold pyridoxal phosphate-dependent enzyme [Burkholderiales bacterium]
YGTFTPLQVAAIEALNGQQDIVAQVRQEYQDRRDLLVKGLHDIGWEVEKPKASMYIWAELPDFYKPMGSVEFSNRLLDKAKVAVSPGIGFGEYGEGFVRIAMIENADRLRQAIRGIKKMFEEDGYIKKHHHKQQSITRKWKGMTAPEPTPDVQHSTAKVSSVHHITTKEEKAMKKHREGAVKAQMKAEKKAEKAEKAERKAAKKAEAAAKAEAEARAEAQAN